MSFTWSYDNLVIHTYIFDELIVAINHPKTWLCKYFEESCMSAKCLCCWYNLGMSCWHLQSHQCLDTPVWTRAILWRWGQPWVAVIQNSHVHCLIEAIWMGNHKYLLLSIPCISFHLLPILSSCLLNTASLGFWLTIFGEKLVRGLVGPTIVSDAGPS